MCHSKMTAIPQEVFIPSRCPPSWYGCCDYSQIGFYGLKMLLKMMQACLLWKMKLCRFLHAFGMFPLKTLRELCRILHTPGMSSLKTLRELCRFYTLLYEFLILDLFFPRPKNLDGLAVVHRLIDAFHVEVVCVICFCCAWSDYFSWVQGSIPCLYSTIIL